MAEVRAAGGWTGGAGADVMGRYLAGSHHPQQALEPRAIFLATEGRELLGFIAGHLTRRFGCGGELQWLFVAPTRRGSGVADQLFERLVTWFAAHDAARVCVNVEPANAAARRFYARHGAEVLSEHWMLWERLTPPQPAAGVEAPAG